MTTSLTLAEIQFLADTGKDLPKGWRWRRESLADRPIDYIDPAPKPFVTQIPLVEYFERIKRLKTDAWQKDFCSRLQHAVETRHIKRTWAEYHAEAQLGKTVILSQAFQAWCLGHDPLWRAVLAMYNSSRSETHSDVVIQIMRSPMHLDIFPNKDSQLPSSVSKEGWSTNARKELNDGQKSFNPVGLQSGITGSGFDWLTIDDPYKEPKDAFSETVRNNLARFWEYGVDPRLTPYSCIAAMFHRYSPDDFGGYLLDTGEFDYVRYATEADGPYIHDETGQKFNDPLGRREGELISPERRPESYYTGKRKNKQVWLSMFQGRPSSEEGEFFNVGQIKILTDAKLIAQRKQECSVFVRAWDLAATDEGGDYSVAPLTGMSADKRFTWFDVARKQVESAGRDQLMLATAEKDGPDVVISVPQDPGAAGLTALFHIQQLLKGFPVVARPTSGSKIDRARPLASAVNEGLLSFVTDEHLEKDQQWIKAAKRELRDFPLGIDHDDFVDAGADAYNECFERISKGLVIKNYVPQRNLVTWESFNARFGSTIPKHWKIYAGVKITLEASTPNSAILIARSAQNSGVDALFVIAEYKEYTADYHDLFDWLDRAIQHYCGSNPTLIWLHNDSESFKVTIQQKVKRNVRVFKGENVDGITELDWHLKASETVHPFVAYEKSAHLYGLIDSSQLSVAVNADGLFNFRQEAVTWNFNSKQEPSAVGSVLVCAQMIAHQFRTVAVPLTVEEKVNELVPKDVLEAVQTARTGEQRLTANMNLEFQRDAAHALLYPEQDEFDDFLE